MLPTTTSALLTHCAHMGSRLPAVPERLTRLRRPVGDHAGEPRGDELREASLLLVRPLKPREHRDVALARGGDELRRGRVLVRRYGPRADGLRVGEESFVTRRIEGVAQQSDL